MQRYLGLVAGNYCRQQSLTIPLHSESTLNVTQDVTQNVTQDVTQNVTMWTFDCVYLTGQSKFRSQINEGMRPIDLNAVNDTTTSHDAANGATFSNAPGRTPIT